MTRGGFILMSVGGLTLDPVTKTPIVVLRDSENKLNLPIWIGLLEATAMATELEGLKMARPMTHDLLNTVINELGAAVEAIEVNDLKEVFHCFMSPGAITERIHLFVGNYSARSGKGGGLQDEGEDIEVLEMPLADAIAMIERGEIIDAKTIMLLLWVQMNRT